MFYVQINEYYYDHGTKILAYSQKVGPFDTACKAAEWMEEYWEFGGFEELCGVEMDVVEEG